jgi:hypothetical protein
LAKREQQRPLNQAWYAAELKKLGSEGKGPPQAIVYKDGVMVLDKKEYQRPQMEPAKGWAGQPLQSLDVYQREYKETGEKIRKELARIKSLIEENKALTSELIGEKGARQRLADELLKLWHLQAEEKNVRELETNARTDLGRLTERNKRLRAWIDELEGSKANAAR